MLGNRKISSTAVIHFGLAFGLGLALVLQLLAYSNTSIVDFSAFKVGSLLVVCLCNASAILAAINTGFDLSRQRLYAVVGSEALALLAAFYATKDAGQISAMYFFWITLALHALFSFCLTAILMTQIRMSEDLALYPKIATPIVIILVGTIGFLASSWISLGDFAIYLGLARDLSLLIVPIAFFTVLVAVKPPQLRGKFWPGGRISLKRIGQNYPYGSMFLLITGTGLMANLLLRLIEGLPEAMHSNAAYSNPLDMLSLGWLAVIYENVSHLVALTNEKQQNQINAKLATYSARKFLHRHLSEQSHWAATVGLKTANYLIDHDVDGSLQSSLPASLSLIRSEEIQRCVVEVLASLNFHSHASAHSVSGAIDSEASIRPCVDTLKMFASLYLDAGPLVERRIKGLISLLPIIDPSLAKTLDADQASRLLQRTKWLFHFDFAWLDQHIIHSPVNLRYDVQLATLSDRSRLVILEYFEKTGRTGSFVWMGPEARSRLLQEAPWLASIVHPCPIPDRLKGESGQEELMFTVKFEQLIPRLQRYFDLDEFRMKLTDFEPSAESTRLSRLLQLQLNNSTSIKDIIHVLDQVSGYSWRGFREKDNALQIILTAHQLLAKFESGGEKANTTDTDALRRAEKILLSAVKAIGYPSQILHNAHLNRIALRDLDNLITTASEAFDPRFQEAWLVLATADYQRFTIAQRKQVLNFLAHTSVIPQVAKRPFCQRKAIDTLSSIAKVADREELGSIQESFGIMFLWLANFNSDAETCSLLLDAQLFVEGQLKKQLDLSRTVKEAFLNHVAKLSVRLGVHHPQITSIQSRLHQLKAGDIGAVNVA